MIAGMGIPDYIRKECGREDDLSWEQAEEILRGRKGVVEAKINELDAQIQADADYISEKDAQIKAGPNERRRKQLEIKRDERKEKKAALEKDRESGQTEKSRIVAFEKLLDVEQNIGNASNQTQNRTLLSQAKRDLAKELKSNQELHDAVELLGAKLSIDDRSTKPEGEAAEVPIEILSGASSAGANPPDVKDGAPPDHFQWPICEQLESAASLGIPDEYLNTFEPGNILKLQGKTDEKSEMWYVATKEIRIGRSPDQSEVVTLSTLPEDDPARGDTDSISRHHLTGALDQLNYPEFTAAKNRRAYIGRVNGGQPKKLISYDRPQRMRHAKSVLGFHKPDGRGNRYRLNTELVPPRKIDIKNLAALQGSRLPDDLQQRVGSVLFEPTFGGSKYAFRRTIWLIKSAPLVPLNGLQLYQSPTEPLAMVHYLYGGFWLEPISPAVSCGRNLDAPLPKNSLIPLVSGQVVRLAKTDYEILVSQIFANQG